MPDDAVDLDQVREFYDPHPGWMGAAVPLPDPVKAAAASLAGRRLSLHDALAILGVAAAVGTFQATAGAILYLMPGDGKRHIRHVFRVIRFR